MTRLKRIEEELRPRSKHYDADTKLRILGMIEVSDTGMEPVLKMFGITRPTVRNWRRRYDQDGLAGLESLPHSGRKPKITAEQLVDCVRDIMEDNRVVTTARLHKAILDKYGVNYTMRGLQGALKRNRITRKKTESVHRNVATNQQAGVWRRDNIPLIEYYENEGYATMSMDETHPTLDSTTRHGYSPAGERIYTTYEGKKQRVSVFGGVTEDGRSLFRTYSKCNTGTMIDYLKAVKRQIGKTNVLCDGASYHRSKAIYEWLEKNPEIILTPLPIGSPHMNVIELEWNRLRSHLDKFVFKDKAEFMRCISNFVRTKTITYAVKHKLYSKISPCIIG